MAVPGNGLSGEASSHPPKGGGPPPILRAPGSTKSVISQGFPMVLVKWRSRKPPKTACFARRFSGEGQGFLRVAMSRPASSAGRRGRCWQGMNRLEAFFHSRNVSNHVTIKQHHVSFAIFVWFMNNKMVVHFPSVSFVTDNSPNLDLSD